MTVAQPWTCPTCGSTVATPFCSACGERQLRARDLTLRGLFGQLFQAFSSIDGRLVRSVRCLVSQPGALTVAYVQGRRKPYTEPFQLFLLANVLFFAMQSLTHTNIFSSPLEAHLHHQDWSAVARTLVQHRLERTQTTLDRYAPVFDQAVVVNAKSLIILMVLPFALLLPIVFHRSRRPFVAHVAFSLHLYAFLLLLFCLSVAIAAVERSFGGGGLSSARVDNTLSAINLAACATYLFAATGKVYGASGAVRFLKTMALALAVACLVLGYRFALFLITLYST